MDATSPWRAFAHSGTLDRDAERYWALCEAAEDATADDVIRLLRAAGGEQADPMRWEPMFDPLLRTPGLVDRWRGTDEPLRSSLGHGLLRAGLVAADELPADLCERVAVSFVQGDDAAFLFEELNAEAAVWPPGRFACALREAALATQDPVPWALVCFLAASASPREAMLLRLRAYSDDDPVACGRPLAGPSEPELAALQGLVAEWLAEAEPTTSAMTRFRACRTLFVHGRGSEALDALVPAEMFDWPGDLPANPACGLCGEAHHAGQSPHEPALDSVRLLFRLPIARAMRVLERAETPERAGVTALLRRWLTEGRDASIPDHAALANLPQPVREAVILAWSRLVVAPDGSLPRLLQREVLASLGEPRDLADREASEGTAALADSIRNMRGRVQRLIELRAPLVVVMRDASRLRTLQRLAPWVATSEDEPERQDALGFERELLLSALVLRALAGGDPRFGPMIDQLDRLRRGEPDLGPNVAAAFDADERPAAEPVSAALHYAYCAIDSARGDGERTDQDDLYDIAERAIRLRQDALVQAKDHARLDAEHRRAWWTRWLFEFVPQAAVPTRPLD